MTTPDVVEVSQADIARLRRKSAAPVPDYDDNLLAEILAETTDGDGALNFNRAAREIWVDIAAKYASMTDVIESGAERLLSKLHKNAVGQIALYNKFLAEEADTTLGTVAHLRVVGVSSRPWGAPPAADRVQYGSLGPRG